MRCACVELLANEGFAGVHVGGHSGGAERGVERERRKVELATRRMVVSREIAMSGM